MAKTLEMKMAHAENLPPGHFDYVEPEGAYHGSKMGMWLFIATEILLFSGLFTTFAVFRSKYLDMFNTGAHSLNWKLGALNTIVLLSSSYFMVRGVDSAQHGDNKKTIFWLDLTQLCAFIFLIIKAFEYSSKFNHHIFINTNFFYAFYFIMTGIHALHVIVGMGLIYWLRNLAKKKIYSKNYYTPIEVCGLYWHLVDGIWIFLYPIVYLLSGI